MRRVIADIIVDTLKQLPLAYPSLTAQERAELEQYRRKLEVLRAKS
jgi:hypothetical protein